MLPLILRYGVISGVIVVLPMLWQWLRLEKGEHPPSSLLLGYLVMLLALTVVFIGVKHYRDKLKGGIVKFWPAFGVGFAISLVACVMYAIGWEIVMAFGSFDFGTWYSNEMIAHAKSAGKTGAELEKALAEARDFVAMYRKPWIRFPMTLAEMLPVGLLVSLITAAVLRNPRVLPARAA